jgi:hypothetical protein
MKRKKAYESPIAANLLSFKDQIACFNLKLDFDCWISWALDAIRTCLLDSFVERGEGTYGIGPCYWSDVFQVYVLEYESSSFPALDISSLLLLLLPLLPHCSQMKRE